MEPKNRAAVAMGRIKSPARAAASAANGALGGSLPLARMYRRTDGAEVTGAIKCAMPGMPWTIPNPGSVPAAIVDALADGQAVRIGQSHTDADGRAWIGAPTAADGRQRTTRGTLAVVREHVAAALEAFGLIWTEREHCPHIHAAAGFRHLRQALERETPPRTAPLPVDPSIDRRDIGAAAHLNLAILERLRLGPATGGDLAAICSRYGARIHDLREAGHVINKERAGRMSWRYSLEAAP
jgi:hypothetical protein